MYLSDEALSVTKRLMLRYPEGKLNCQPHGDRPEGPYRDLHAPWFDFGYSAIDGHIFVDDGGKPYLYFSRNGFQDGYSFGSVSESASHILNDPLHYPGKWHEEDCQPGCRSPLSHRAQRRLPITANTTPLATQWLL